VLAVLAQPLIPQFNCPKLNNPSPATNVNELRPGNIKALMAAGDSITAGFAMMSTKATDLLKFNSNIREYRANVFSIGANTTNSLNNYLSFYNPGLVGASTGYTSPVGGMKNDYMMVSLPNPTESKLNAGESGAIADDIISQIDYLKNQLQTTYKGVVDFDNDWKHLAPINRVKCLCQACVNETRASPANYESSLDDALSHLQKEIPRVFVSVITLFNLSTVYNTFQTSDYCKNVRSSIFNTECLCIAKDYTPAGLQKVDDYAVQYNQILYKLASKYQAKKDPNFTVKVQPCTENFVIPSNIGTQFLSQFDCFHPSAYADGVMAVALWNNLMSPSQSAKLNTLVLDAPVSCPTDDTYLM
jgi:lysophospholipase L1-like esterase